MIKGFNRIMIVSKLTKLLTVSLIGIVFCNTGFSEFLTQNTKCLKLVQIVGALSIGGQKNNVKAELDNKAVFAWLLEHKIIDKTGKWLGINKVDANGVKIKKGETSEATSDGNVRFITKSYLDAPDLKWERGSDNVSVKATTNVSEVQTKDGKQFVTVTTKNTFTGDDEQVIPVKGNDTAVTTAVNNANTDTFPDLTQSETSTQNIYLSVDPSNLPKYGFNNDALYNFTQQLNEKNALPGSISKWTFNLSGSLGIRINSSFGGYMAAGIEGTIPVYNKTTTIELGKDGASSGTSESESKNSNDNSSTVNGWLVDLKQKYGISIFGEVGVPLSEHFEFAVRIGAMWYFYESSISNNKENDTGSSNQESKNCFLKQKQDMTGRAIFGEVDGNYFVNNNFGIGVYVKFSGPCQLKEKDTNSSDESSNTSGTNNNGFPLSVTKLHGVEIGVKLLLKF